MPERVTVKVLHVETGRHVYGGAQQVLWLARGLERHGVQSSLVCAVDSAVAGVAAEQGLNVASLRCHGDLDLGFGWALRGLLRRERPDLVHCHSRRGADLLGGRAAAAAGIPAVVSRRVDNREYRWLARLRYRPYARIVAISGAVAGALRADGIDAERIVTIRSAVDTARFAGGPDERGFRERFGFGPGERVLFAVGQLIPRKGHALLLEAVARLAGDYPDLRLVIFGQGPLEGELRQQIAALDLVGVVKLAGFRADLDDYLGCAELLVHPALTEGLGVAALKAAAAGLPVIAFAAGGLPEAVLDGETGLLVPPGDVAALAAAIAALLDDPARSRQFGERGRQRMQQEFSVEAMVDAHHALYREVLGG